ncbi:B12-binding domain-containing radical SAM protein [Roseibium album]|uniref:B12-binding domain-containing radical SAM protein n=1 Tax=Roseibium album TaxID=311410 RepID=UPI002492330A|nr:radical SAM protein [Roseibium album]
MRLKIVFPPFAESATHGPHLAAPLLTAILRERGHLADALDWNIEAIRRLTTPKMLDDLHRRLSGRYPPNHAVRLFIEHTKASGVAILAESSAQFVQRLLSLFRAEYGLQTRSLDECIASPATPDMRAIIGEQDFVRTIKASGVDSIGFTVAFAEQLSSVVHMAKALRAAMPALPILVGGSQINLLETPQIEGLKDTGLFDAIFIGNGETAIASLFETRAKRTGTCDIVRSGPITSSQLDMLPAPQFTELGRYFVPLRLPTLVTKGCFWGQCTFCDYVRLSNLAGKRFIARTPARVLEEITGYRDRYGACSILLVSDAVPPAWYRKLAQHSVDSGVSLKSSSYMMHSASLTVEDFKLFGAAGVESINFGTESTNDRLLSLMKKPSNYQTIVKNLRDAKRVGIYTVVNSIVDFPTTTFAEATDVLSDFTRLMPYMDVFNPSAFDVTAGTTVSEQPKAFGIDVKTDAYIKTDHGFHSLQIANDGSMTRAQRDKLLAQYRHLAAACALRLRQREAGRPGKDTRSLTLDPAAILLEEETPRVNFLSLGIVRKVTAEERSILRRLFDRPGRVWTPEEVQAVASNSEGQLSKHEASRFPERLHELGLLVRPTGGRG